MILDYKPLYLWNFNSVVLKSSYVVISYFRLVFQTFWHSKRNLASYKCPYQGLVVGQKLSLVNFTAVKPLLIQMVKLANNEFLSTPFLTRQTI